MTEFEKMQQGLPYSPADAELTQFRYASRRLCQQINAIDPADTGMLEIAITKLFARKGKGVVVESPFTCSYGMNVHVGNNVAFGPNCTIIDSGHVEIGNNVMIGPSVGIYTITQGLLPLEVQSGEQEISLPVIIGNNVVVGGNSVIKAGVCIGEGAVVEAGSVIDADIEPFSVVSGNPASVIRHLR